MRIGRIATTITFFLVLTVALGQSGITRGPYLQKATQHSIVIRWKTLDTTIAKVTYGFDPQNLTETKIDITQDDDHTVELTGLLPNTRYYYAVHDANNLLASGSNLYFETLPESGEPGEYTFLVLGDAGQGTSGQREVSRALEEVYGTHHDGVLLLGDNAYWSGTQSEYQQKFFDGYYNNIIENTVIWPAPGNHDYYGATIPMSTDAPYFDIFNVPTQGECGGVPSNTEQIYSYDIGNIHFLSLDSYALDRTETGYMASWLEDDLSQNKLPWVIAYWHHPPYSKGSHDSDNINGGEHELVEMREGIVPILEKYDVDLVLAGHSHSYERSILIAGHYGLSETFSQAHVRNNSSGNFPGFCPYVKVLDTTPIPRQGTVYSVVGVSGWTSGVKPGWPHPIMHSYSNTELGGMFIRVKGNELVAEFLTDERVVYDRFVILKGEEGSPELEYQDCYSAWNVYPNPGNGWVYLDHSLYEFNPSDGYEVYDMNGRLVDSGPLATDLLLDFSKEVAGMYVIRIRDGSGLQHFKYIKL